MRSFIKSVVTFWVLFTIVLGLYDITTTKIIQSFANFRLNTRPQIIVFGHSHSECAYNDSLINNLRNLSDSSEAYSYTYVKARKVLEQNESINTVLIEFTNGNIIEQMNDWIWDDINLSNNFTRLSPFVNTTDKIVFFKENPEGFISALFVSCKKRLGQIFKRDFIYTNRIGGYNYSVRDKIDSLISASNNINKKELEFYSGDKISEINLHYLVRTIELCKEYNKKVFLIRSPLHNNYVGYRN